MIVLCKDYSSPFNDKVTRHYVSELYWVNRTPHATFTPNAREALKFRSMLDLIHALDRVSASQRRFLMSWHVTRAKGKKNAYKPAGELPALPAPQPVPALPAPQIAGLLPARVQKPKIVWIAAPGNDVPSDPNYYPKRIA